MLYIIIFLSSLSIFQTKNIILPFKKMTVETFRETKTISDFLDFNIYTNITMGTPKKLVAHFISKSGALFSYSRLKLQYHATPEYEKIEERFEKYLNIFYNISDSSSNEEVDTYSGVYSDIFYLYDSTGKENEYIFEFNVNMNARFEKLVGAIDLYNQFDPHDKYNKYFFKVLKDNNVIDDYYITFTYEEYNLDNKLIYFNDDYHKLLGNLILGDCPHKFNPEKYKEEDQIVVNGNHFLDINEIKFKSKISNYTANDERIFFKFNSEFMRASKTFKNEVDKFFFNELMSNNLCRADRVKEHIYISEDIIYSCENNEIINEKIKNFPTLYFEIKVSNLIFLFNYKELFKLYNDRLYFLFIFKSSAWEFGELFLRKYTTSFHYDGNFISFYKQQVDEINKKTDILDPEETDSEEPKYDPYEKKRENKSYVRIIIEIVMGVIILITVTVIIILIIRWKKTRKKRADELSDDYDYTPQGIINE